ncbi:MAG: DUF1015 domain-containing protein [Candidatus Omnitrophica bacterium]|nr:DUF1015 domain-containing protein [Candidatus Omnitrophota bacterium]
MADIRPFRGVLYNLKKVKDIARVVTEPYDVISPAQQSKYYRTHPNNIIRLILGKQYPSDNSRVNQYTRSREFFADWLKKDVLQRDAQESIYIYNQTFRHHNSKKTRIGFIALLKLEDFAKNTILPHENTFAHPVQDRQKLLQTVRANLSPIFAVFFDRETKLNQLLNQFSQRHRPQIVVEKDHVLHSLWRMSERKKVAAIKKLLKDKQIFIADGHHRYESALNYKKLMEKNNSSKNRGYQPYDYVMTYLVSSSDPGLTILPTHRVIKMSKISAEQTITRLKKYFQLQAFSASEDLFKYLYQKQDRAVFGVYLGRNKFFGFVAQRNLDVTVLHGSILSKVLKLNLGPGDICYTRDAQEAIKLVNQRRYQLAFFLRPATVTQVKRVARAGKRMPHKSTYFYPKPLSGLVINKL